MRDRLTEELNTLRLTSAEDRDDLSARLSDVTHKLTEVQKELILKDEELEELRCVRCFI